MKMNTMNLQLERPIAEFEWKTFAICVCVYACVLGACAGAWTGDCVCACVVPSWTHYFKSLLIWLLLNIGGVWFYMVYLSSLPALAAWLMYFGYDQHALSHNMTHPHMLSSIYCSAFSLILLLIVLFKWGSEFF